MHTTIKRRENFGSRQLELRLLKLRGSQIDIRLGLFSGGRRPVDLGLRNGIRFDESQFSLFIQLGQLQCRFGSQQSRLGHRDGRSVVARVDFNEEFTGGKESTRLKRRADLRDHTSNFGRQRDLIVSLDDPVRFDNDRVVNHLKFLDSRTQGPLRIRGSRLHPQPRRQVSNSRTNLRQGLHRAASAQAQPAVCRILMFAVAIRCSKLSILLPNARPWRQHGKGLPRGKRASACNAFAVIRYCVGGEIGPPEVHWRRPRYKDQQSTPLYLVVAPVAAHVGTNFATGSPYFLFLSARSDSALPGSLSLSASQLQPQTTLQVSRNLENFNHYGDEIATLAPRTRSYTALAQSGCTAGTENNEESGDEEYTDFPR